MSNASEVEVKVRIVCMNANYIDPQEAAAFGTLDWSNTMTPTPPYRPSQPVIDPSHVMVNFNLADDMNLGGHGGGLLLKTSDAKKLNLMVGDTLTLKLSKT